MNAQYAWINRYGYTDYPCVPPKYVTLWPFPWRKRALVDYRVIDNEFPPMFCDGPVLYRNDNHCESDKGTIPPLVTYLLGIDPDDAPPSFYHHDLLYRTGGIWKMVSDAWVFIPLTRDECDVLLYKMLLACDYPEWKARSVYYGLKIGGSVAWERHNESRKIEEQKRRGSDEQKDTGKSVGDSTNG